MWATQKNFFELRERGRWKVEFFCPTSEPATSSDDSMLVPLGEILEERRETIDPLSLDEGLINYIGLEHIQSFTGELVNFHPKRTGEIKSRSKIFYEDDVLYGRLRPTLNKVWLAEKMPEGICSTEFFVLIPNKKKMRPIVLRYLLSSHYIQRHAERLQTGAALPRMNLDDFLNIKIPVPHMEVQKKIEAVLIKRFQQLQEMRQKISAFPDFIVQDLLRAIEGDQGSENKSRSNS